MKKRITFQPFRLFWIVAMSVLPLLGACQKEEKMKEQETIAFRDLTANSNNCNVQDFGDKGFVLIFDNEQLKKHIICDEIQWTIDFDEEFIIAGKINLPNYPSTLTSQKLGIKGGNLSYVLDVDMGFSTQPSSIYFMSAVPKKYSNMQVEVITQVNNND